MADDLKSLARRLKAAGRRDLTREMNAGIRKAILPLRKELPDSARRTLPRRGGLAERVAVSKFSVRKHQNGLTVVIKNSYGIKAMDDGLIRHPVFPSGSRGTWGWARQRVRPGWFSTPLAKVGPDASKALEEALDNVARKIESG